MCIYIRNTIRLFLFPRTRFRLAEKRITTKGIKDFPGIILPYKNAVEIARVFSESSDTVRALFSKHHASFFF